jgi:hypothetical protein
MHSLSIALASTALLLAACAQLPGGGRDDMPPPERRAAAEQGPTPGSGSTGAAQGAGADADLGVDLRQPPRWRSAEGLVTPLPPPGAPSVDGAPPGAVDIGALPEGDPALRSLVAERCASRPAGVTEASFLRGLAADLDADGVDPSLAVDALIIGRCGDLADIVTEVVAQGGEAAAMPVIERAVALAGSGSALIVERAAAEGLMLAGRERVAPTSLAPPALAGSGEYAMLYFPLGADAVTDNGTVSLTQLFGNAEPGYGIYTYILGGGGVGTTGEGADTYRELLRVIETYVLVAGHEGARPDRGAHTFLVPVHAGRAGASLEERTSPELSAAMRRELAAYLRHGGEQGLANRLATAPGPFLVSSLEPRLVPGNAQAARMIVDLSAIGPEYMYSVVDAYDREIPPEAAGRAESLLAVRGRLIGLFPDPAIDTAAGLPPAGDWVFMLGRRSTALHPTAGHAVALAHLGSARRAANPQRR